VARGKRINVLVVCDQSEKSYQWSFSRLTLRILICAAVLTVLMAMAAVFLAWRLTVQSKRTVELAAENRSLTVYTLQVNQLKEELAYHRDFTRRICELIGIEFPDTTFPLSGEVPRSMASAETGDSTSALSVDQKEYLRLAGDALLPGRLSPHPENKPRGVPMRGRMSRGFVPDEENISLRHYGLDIAGRAGSPVFVTAAGVVESVGWDAALGNVIIIDHGNGYKTIYGHNSMIMYETGDEVQFGDMICLSGNSGVSSAPHLHYEIRFNNQPVDPLDFVLPDSTSAMLNNRTEQ